MRPKLILALSLLLLPASTAAQSVRFQSQAISTRGAGIANATVAVCTQPANTNTQPCSPLATLATSTSTTSGGANPLTADSFGNFFFYAAPGRYTVQIYGPAVFGQLVLPDTEVSSIVANAAGSFSSINNTLYVSTFAGADLGAKMNSAVAQCTTLGLTACRYVLDVSGTISTAPNFPSGSIVDCAANSPITLATTWTILHRNTVYNGNGCNLNYNQDNSSAAVLIGKNATGTVNTAGTAVTFVSGTNFANIDVGDQAAINGVVYNICGVTPPNTMTLCSTAGTQSGVAYAAIMNPNQGLGTYPHSVVFRDWLINYTGAGTTASKGLQSVLVYKPVVSNVHISSFNGTGSVGLQFNGTQDANVSDLSLISNNCQMIVDKSVAGGNTSVSQFNVFSGGIVFSSGTCGGAGNAAIHFANGSGANRLKDVDIEGNTATFAVSTDAPAGNIAGTVVEHCYFQNNGDGTASSADINFTSGTMNISQGNIHTSSSSNHPNTGVICTGSTTVCDVADDRWDNVPNYATSWSFVSSATGRVQGNIPSTTAHTDPPGVQDNAGNFTGTGVFNSALVTDGDNFTALASVNGAHDIHFANAGGALWVGVDNNGGSDFLGGAFVSNFYSPSNQVQIKAPAVKITGPILSTGTAVTFTGTGACATFGTNNSGAFAGSSSCASATAASTLTITFAVAAVHGYACNVQDETTRANLFQQTAHTTTTCVLTATSVTQNDVFVFTATGF